MRILRNILMVLMVAGMPAATASVDAEEGLPLGEKLVYHVTWWGIPVAHGTVWVKEIIRLEGREVYHIYGRLDTNAVLSTVFPMHDEVHSWVDVRTLESVAFEKEIDEPFLNVHEKSTFDSNIRKGRFESFDDGEPVEKAAFDIIPPVQDFLSAFYWARRQDLRAGGSKRTVVSVDQLNWDLTIEVKEKDEMKYAGEKVPVLQVIPWTVVNGEEKKRRARLYVTLDPSHTPLKIRYKSAIGWVTGKLQHDGDDTEHDPDDDKDRD